MQTPGFLAFPVLCCAQSLSRVRLFATPQTVAHQAPLSMEFSRQEYWSGLPSPLQRLNLHLLCLLHCRFFTI